MTEKKLIFVNTWLWLFSRGVGDMYNPEWGNRGLTVKQWARHLFNYEGG